MRPIFQYQLSLADYPPIGNNRKDEKRKRDKENQEEAAVATPKYSALYRDRLVFGKGSASKIEGVTVSSTKLIPAKTKTIFVSRLKPSTSCEEVLDHLVSSNLIANQSDAKCFKLVKSGRDLSELSFVSFKLVVPEESFELIIDPSVWPEKIAVREFVESPQRKLSVASLSFKRFRETKNTPDPAIETSQTTDDIMKTPTANGTIDLTGGPSIIDSLDTYMSKQTSPTPKNSME